jgi:hypothetical protein
VSTKFSTIVLQTAQQWTIANGPWELPCQGVKTSKSMKWKQHMRRNPLYDKAAPEEANPTGSQGRGKDS